MKRLKLNTPAAEETHETMTCCRFIRRKVLDSRNPLRQSNLFCRKRIDFAVSSGKPQKNKFILAIL
jgi:hypothetical protein